MIENMNEFMRHIAKSCATVKESSISLSKLNSQTNEAIDGIACSMESITNNSNEVALYSMQGDQKTKIIGNRIKELNEFCNEMNVYSNKVKNLSQNGTDLLNSLVEKTSERSHIAKDVHLAMKENYNISVEIESIIATVVTIAQQTNLLALNASIEAARAGEHGSGFTVVAEEVRKLAQQSAHAVEDIKGLIYGMQNVSKNAVELLGDTKNLQIQQEELVEKSFIFNKDIIANIVDLSQRIDLFSKNCNEINEVSSEVEEFIEKIAYSAQEVAASTQEVSACTEESVGSLQEVSNYSIKLSSLCIDLDNMLKKFII